MGESHVLALVGMTTATPSGAVFLLGGVVRMPARLKSIMSPGECSNPGLGLDDHGVLDVMSSLEGSSWSYRPFAGC